MDSVADVLKERLSYLDVLITRLKESIAGMPAGNLRLTSERGKTRFYKSVPGKKWQYVCASDEKTLKALAQKEYEMKLLMDAINERSQIQSYLKTLHLANPETALQSLDARIRKFVEIALSSDESYARKWHGTEFEQHWKTEYHRIETLSKDMVMSKSEALIADRLFTEGIPFHYEQVLRLGKGFNQVVFYPDFTILNKRTRKLYYWEHLGLMGDRNYCLDNLAKLDVYAKYGIVQGKNLILSYESEGKTLSMAYVRKMIREFLT